MVGHYDEQIDAHYEKEYLEQVRKGTASRPGFHNYMMGIAMMVGTRSRDPNTKVGCVIVRPDKSICSTGYNGFPRRVVDWKHLWEDKRRKYERVIHAEMNAILASKEPVEGYNLYTTLYPCPDCAKHIIAAGIESVMVPQEHRFRREHELSKQLFSEGGVSVVNV
jgi:dCMP deaminase